MNREEGDALRAELEARREEIATLRGVVAALRTRAPVPQGRTAERPGGAPSRTLALVIAAVALAALLAAKSWLIAMLCR